jgi:hypothetical protein
VTYAEYQARCGCRKFFRTWPLDVPPKADYDATVRQAVLDRLLRDRLNVEQTKEAMRRDFFVSLSDGFVYDCLHWQLARLDLPGHRRMVLERFSGTLCVDELHLGRHTLVLATDPLADLPVGFALVGANDQEHMRRFLRNLAAWGVQPRVVVSDGSNLYPGLLAEVWPGAVHQLCVFHVLRDVLDKVLAAVRRLRQAKARRGRAGRKPKRGRAGRKVKRGPTAKEKAAFIGRHRFLIVKRAERLTDQDRQDLEQMFAYAPELGHLRRFCQGIYQLLDDSTTLRVARRRYTLLRQDPAYAGVRELVEALDLLAGPKLSKVMAFVGVPRRRRVRTNNHVERLNRRLRFAEKVRYRWRRRKWVVRWVVLLLDVSWREASAAGEKSGKAASAKRAPPGARGRGKQKVA